MAFLDYTGLSRFKSLIDQFFIKSVNGKTPDSSGAVSITRSDIGAASTDVVSKTANGLAPQLPDELTTTKYLRQDGTWAQPPGAEYESKAAAQGGTDVSLVTTGDKYNWNNKADDSGVVHNTGNETVAGNKTFTSDIRMTVATTNKKLYFKHNEDTNGISANINVNAGNATNQTVNQMSFVEYSPKSTASTDNTGFCERYYLPTPTKGLSGDAEYNIYTSKDLTSATAASGGTALSLVTTGEKYTWNNKASSDTHRIVQLNGTEKLSASGSTPLNLIPGTNVTITYASGGAFTIAATDTTYESKAAAEGGTAVSLVTTGQKYTWNNKAETSDCLLRTGNQTSTGIKTLYGLQIRSAAGSASRYKALWFTQVAGTDGEAAANERCAGIYVDAGHATNQTVNRMRFYQYSPSSTTSATNTGYSEQYYLPTPEKDLSESKTYSIITTKNLPSASDLGVKAVQTAVSDPTASGTGVTYIATLSQNAQGVITATKSTVRTMSAASSSAAGATGLVPQPAKGKQASFLRGDATWAVPTDTTYSSGTGTSIDSSNNINNTGVISAAAGASNGQIKFTVGNANGTTSDQNVTVTGINNAAYKDVADNSSATALTNSATTLPTVRKIYYAIKNNVTTTAGGYMLDARIGKDLNNAITSLFKIVKYTASWSNLAANTNKDLTGTNFSISTPSNYTPAAVLEVSPGNASCIVAWYDGGQTGSSTVMRIRNVTTSTTGTSAQTASITILYVKTASVVSS